MFSQSKPVSQVPLNFYFAVMYTFAKEAQGDATILTQSPYTSSLSYSYAWHPEAQTEKNSGLF